MLPEPSPEAYRRLLRLRTVRRYRPEAIPDAALEQILEAGRWTGSSKNTQPWAFVVVGLPWRRSSRAWTVSTSKTGTSGRTSSRFPDRQKGTTHKRDGRHLIVAKHRSDVGARP